MDFEIVKMKRKYAKIISGWKYGEEYSYCDFYGWKSEKKELRSGLYFAVLSQGKVAGFLSFGPSAQWPAESMKSIYRDQSFTDIAMGLAPENCGKGLGGDFCDACFDYTKKIFPQDGIRLSVDARNKRALSVYEKKGFTCVTRKSFEDRPDILILTRN